MICVYYIKYYIITTFDFFSSVFSKAALRDGTVTARADVIIIILNKGRESLANNKVAMSCCLITLYIVDRGLYCYFAFSSVFCVRVCVCVYV